VKNFLQGHTELYSSYPPQPDITRPDHLLPSAAATAKKACLVAAQRSSESTGGAGSQAGEGAEGEPRWDNSSEQSVELTGALPLVPKGHRLVRKCKAQEVKSSRY
jgi:hypothetical protein